MPKTLTEAKWTQVAKDAYYKERPWAFAGPNQSYPIKDKSDVGDAWGLAGHADNPDAVRAKIISIAKRLKLTDGLPDTAKAAMKDKEDDTEAEEQEEEEETTESIDTPLAITPAKSKIATLRVRWLQDDAISLNGRQYPTEACNTLLRSAQRTLADPGAPPLTCYVSHGTADMDDSLKLVGTPSKVWREGNDLLALIDVPNTHAGRDIVELAANGYLKPVSLRAVNAEMKLDRNKGIPQVGGANLTLKGIDFTTEPGLPGVGTVQDVTLFESTQPISLTEVFDFHKDATAIIESSEETPMKKTLQEDVIPPMASGVTQGMDNADPQGDYAKKNMPVPNVMMTPGTPALTQEDMEEAHNHAATMLNMPCAPSSREAGKSLSKANADRLGKIHDSMAKALGKGCSYESFKAASKGADMPPDDQDGDDDQAPPALVYKHESAKPNKPVQENKSMELTPEEMVRRLQESGYAVQAPKTKEELLQEQFEARLAEQQKAFEAKLEEQQKAILAALKPQQETPQRRSLVEGANVDTTPRRNLYEHGSYIQNRLQEADIETIADRSAPLPDGINADYLLKEFGTVLFKNIMQQQYLQGLM